jgi:hypothetical protein
MVVVAVAVAAVAAGSARGAMATTRTPCGKIPGPNWSFPAGAPSGASYNVTAFGQFTCKSAKAWAAKLIKDPAPDHSNKVNPNVLKDGPPGYHCGAGSSKQGKAYSGECTKGPVFNPTSGFSRGLSLH